MPVPHSHAGRPFWMDRVNVDPLDSDPDILEGTQAFEDKAFDVSDLYRTTVEDRATQPAMTKIGAAVILGGIALGIGALVGIACGQEND